MNATHFRAARGGSFAGSAANFAQSNRDIGNEFGMGKTLLSLRRYSRMSKANSLKNCLFGFVCVFATMLVQSYSARASALDIFYSESSLSEARANVLIMSRRELTTFSDWLAECTDSLSQNELIRHNCTVVEKRYLLEYDQARPIDEEIRALDLISLKLRAEEAANARQKSDSAAILRLSHIVQVLENAANNRFHFLNNRHPVAE